MKWNVPERNGTGGTRNRNWRTGRRGRGDREEGAGTEWREADIRGGAVGEQSGFAGVFDGSSEHCADGGGVGWIGRGDRVIEGCGGWALGEMSAIAGRIRDRLCLDVRLFCIGAAFAKTVFDQAFSLPSRAQANHFSRSGILGLRNALNVRFSKSIILHLKMSII